MVIQRGKVPLWYLLASAVVATVMGSLGLHLQQDLRFGPGVTIYILLVSNIVWLTFAFWLARERKSLLTALLYGAASPYIAGSVLGAPPMWVLITLEWYRFIPVGLATGGMVYVLSTFARRNAELRG